MIDQGIANNRARKNRNSARVTLFSPDFINLPVCHIKSRKPAMTARVVRIMRILTMSIRFEQDITQALDFQAMRDN